MRLETPLSSSGGELERLNPPQPSCDPVPTGAVLVHNPPSSNGRRPHDLVEEKQRGPASLHHPDAPPTRVLFRRRERDRRSEIHELPLQHLASLIPVPAAWHPSPTQVPRIRPSPVDDGGVARPVPQRVASSRRGRATAPLGEGERAVLKPPGTEEPTGWIRGNRPSGCEVREPGDRRTLVSARWVLGSPPIAPLGDRVQRSIPHTPGTPCRPTRPTRRA